MAPEVQKAKLKQFEDFLTALEEKYPEELLLPNRTRRWYVAFGTKENPPDIIYVPSEDLPKHIEKEMREFVKGLFP